jgi:hypothetical protein
MRRQNYGVPHRQIDEQLGYFLSVLPEVHRAAGEPPRVLRRLKLVTGGDWGSSLVPAVAFAGAAWNFPWIR